MKYKNDWMGTAIKKCIESEINKAVAKTIEKQTRKEDEPKLVQFLIDEIERNVDSINICLNEISQKTKTKYGDAEINIIAHIEDIKREGMKTGIDLALIVDINLKSKRVLKGSLIQVKLASVERKDVDDLSSELPAERLEDQIEKLENFPERSTYIMYFLPPKLTDPDKKHRLIALSPVVMPLSVYKGFKSSPTVREFVENGLDFTTFYVDGMLGTHEGSRNVIIEKDGSNIKIDERFSFVDKYGKEFSIKHWVDAILYFKISEIGSATVLEEFL